MSLSKEGRKVYMANDKHLYAVILAGGGGTRLWPKSVKGNPKQFLKLVSDKTMMQLAANRMNKFVDWDHFIVVTNEMYIDEVKKQLPEVPADQIIAEPERRETALAMLTGALYAKMLDPEAVVINIASDHVVVDNQEFQRVMEAAATVAAKKENLISIGITPTFPTSAFGYVKIGAQLDDLGERLPLYKVDSFTEKPNKETAQEYIDTGKYFWNANMYVWSADAIDNAFAKYMPEMHQLTRKFVGIDNKTFHQVLPDIYHQAESISIDYAISEKTDNLVLIPGDFGWDDVGDWRVVYQLSQKNEDENVIIKDNGGEVITIDSKQNLVYPDKKMIAMVGVDDLIVVDTPNALLILPKERSQEVKKIVEKLKEDNRTELL